MTTSIEKLITFIQNDEPPLKADEYTLTVTQTTNTALPNSFQTIRQFAVSGARFSFTSGEIDSVFPPNLADGAFDGCLPSVTFNRRTLPWERYLEAGNETAPWLAVLLFDDATKPALVKRTAADLIPLGKPITAYGDPSVKGTGALPAGTFASPGLNPLEYGETPEDICTTIDVPIATFSAIAPGVADLEYLAHIRQVDTIDTVSNEDEMTRFSVVLGNRIGQNNKASRAFLVSLENLGAYLPGDDGTPATFPEGTTTLRLICYRSWQFTANTSDQDFLALLENLNAPGPGNILLTNLQYPSGQPLPAASAVQSALTSQAAGTLTDDEARTLALNAFGQGYIPMNEAFRHAAASVSWYRGPCIPFGQSTLAFQSVASPDAANRYDPSTGMFDVSYGAAWQLGQLLALKNKQYASALYNWKKQVTAVNAAAAEQAILAAALEPIAGSAEGASALFGGLLAKRQARLDAPLPDSVGSFLAGLKLLEGVPFSYLVPDEGMLPLESIRFFSLDLTWVDYLIDGAFSIGRTNSAQQTRDATLFHRVSGEADTVRHLRRKQRPRLASRMQAAPATFTGFILRSSVLSGWPNLQVNGYAQIDDLDSELKTLRMSMCGPTAMICIFDGDVQQVALHQPPEQLHSGVELNRDGIPVSTTLRAVTGATPGSPFTSDPKGGSPVVAMVMRSDGQTLAVANSALAIKTKLNNDFSQNIQAFTSAEFALEMVKGVVKVNFNRQM